MKQAGMLLFILCFLPHFAAALSLGNITVQSALHEPLRAKIPIYDQGATPASELIARISPVQISDIISLEQTQLLSTINFALKTNHEGQLSLAISTKEPMEEPFLRLPIMLSWPDGELLREYTLFFDPAQEFTPVNKSAQSTQTERKLAG